MSDAERQRQRGLHKAETRRKYSLPVGSTFGHWTILKYTKPRFYLCRCVCGTIREVCRQTLMHHTSPSCGCIGNEIRRSRGRANALKTNIGALWSMTKIKALRCGRVWKLSKKVYQSLIFQPCTYCGVLGTNFKRAARKDAVGSFYYNGVDRLNSKKGYIRGNVTPCCKVCNRAKSDMTIYDFQSWLAQLVDHVNNLPKKVVPALPSTSQK